MSDSPVSPPRDNGFDELWSHYPLVEGYLRRYETSAASSDDLAQDVFVRAYKAVQSHGPPRNPKGWLLRIAHNVAVNNYRRVEPVVHLDSEYHSTLDESISDHNERAHVHRLASSTVDALSFLNDTQRELVYGLYFEGKGCWQLAQEYGLTHQAVKSRLHRARGKLRRYLSALAGYSGTNRF